MGLACTRCLRPISNAKLSLPVPRARFQGRTGQGTKMLTIPCFRPKIDQRKMKPSICPFVRRRHHPVHRQDRCRHRLLLASDSPIPVAKGPMDIHTATTKDHISDLRSRKPLIMALIYSESHLHWQDPSSLKVTNCQALYDGCIPSPSPPENSPPSSFRYIMSIIYHCVEEIMKWCKYVRY